MTECPKIKRIVSEAVLEWARKRPCEGCALPGPSDPAHIRSVGAGGDDTKANLLSLCRLCHSTQHSWGIKKWWRAYGARIRRQRFQAEEPQPKIPWQFSLDDLNKV